MAKNKGLNIGAVIELEGLLTSLRGIDLGELANERRAALTPAERMLEDVLEDKGVVRKMRSKEGRGRAGKKKPTLSWQKKRAKAMKAGKAHYKNYLKPRRIKEKALNLTTAEGWWKEESRIWLHEARKKRDTSFLPKITEKEFVEVLYPAFEGRVPIFKRFDSMKPVSLFNLYVIDMDTDSVLFDGSEYLLRSLGYIL